MPGTVLCAREQDKDKPQACHMVDIQQVKKASLPLHVLQSGIGDNEIIS